MDFLLKLLLTTTLPLFTFAPAPSADTSDLSSYCAVDNLHQEKLKNDAIYFQKHKDLEQAAYDFLHENNGTLTTPPDYILPVVVHIIHDNGTENIDDATVEQGISDLNDAFGNMAYYDQGTGVDTRVQFCLAKRDPEGNLTTGINRVENPLTEMNLENDDLAVKDLIRWEPTKYINIWLVKEICSNGGSGCGIAGYAYYPAAHGMPEDGLVIEAEFFGGSSANSTVSVHEMGHYLGIYHTFEGGCDNTFCLIDGDRVCDTPPDYSVVYVPCEVEPNSCFSDVSAIDPDNPFTEDQPDMIINYMDYSDLNCYSAFTQGQADRMHFFIENARESLLNTNACVDPCPLDLVANFTASALDVEVGTNVEFTNNSIGANEYTWTLNGNLFSTNEDASWLFSNEGTYTINLNILIDTLSFVCNEDFSVEINVSCPVIANFESSDVYPEPGDIVTFTNTSENALNYAWTVNGAPVATTPDFSAPVPLAGNYTICLTADNIICDDEECVTVIAGENIVECDDSFFKTYGSPDETEVGQASVLLSDGSYFLAGGAADNSVLLYFDTNDELIWTRTWDATVGNDYIRQLYLDSDEKLIIAGRNQTFGPNTECYLMKYDYQNDIIEWTRRFSTADASRFERIAENPTNDNYIIAGMTEPATSGSDWWLLEIDRNTGAIVWQTGYSAGDTDILQGLAVYENKIYTGGILRMGGGIETIRPALARYDLEGNLEWSAVYLNTPSDDARVYIQNIQVANDTIYYIGQGNNTTSSLTNGFIYFGKVDLEGNLLWNRRYDIPNSTEGGMNFRLLPDGYLLHGSHRLSSASENNAFVMRLNLAGDVLWTKSLGNINGENLFSSFIKDTYVYTTGFSGHPTTGENDILVSKLALNNDLEVVCEYIQDLDMMVTSLDNYTQFVTETITTPSFSLTIATVTPTDSDILENDFCQAACEELCGNGIDDDGDGLIDCCDPDLFDAPCCEDHPYLDLGQDTMICDNSVFVLDAGEGFVSYIWNDGTTEQTLTTYGPGEYFVTVEDALCGIISDTIEITDLPETVAQADPQFMSICPGESVTITVNPDFDHYEWLPDTYLDCDTCQTVVSTPDQPIQYIVVAHFDNGCYSVDTINIVIDGIQTGETITVCPDETVLIFGEPQSNPGDYSETYQTASGCDSTHVITLENFPPPPISTTVTQSPSCSNPCGAEITISGPTDGLSFSLDGGAFSTDLIYSDLCAGLYLFQVIDAMNCAFSFPVEIPELPQVVAVIDPANASIVIGESVDLNVILSPNVPIESITWTPPTNLSCTNCPNPTASPLQNTTYEAAIIDENGCAYVTSISIEVDNSCRLNADDIPSAFSPNNDDLNDVFEYTAPEGTNAVLTNMLIYNRWGAVVFQSATANATWDGMLNGEPAPTDVYVYIMEVLCNGETTTFRGDVTLLR